MSHIDFDAGRLFIAIAPDPLRGFWVDGEDLDDHADAAELLRRHFDLDDDPDEVMVSDAEGLANEFTSAHGFFGWEEYREAREAAETHGTPAVKAYLENFGSWNEEHFGDSYRGFWNSKQDYAENLVDDLGYLDGIPDHISRYFDYEAFTRDLFMDENWVEDGFGGHVFAEV